MTAEQKYISDCLDKIHQQLANLQGHMPASDHEAHAILGRLEIAYLKPLRALRLHFGIPYSWQAGVEKKHEPLNIPQESRP